MSGYGNAGVTGASAGAETGVGKDLVETHQHENEVIPKFKEILYKDIRKFLENHQEYQKKKSMLDVLQGVGGVGENPAAIQNPSAVASTFGTDMSSPSAVAPVTPKVIQGVSQDAFTSPQDEQRNIAEAVLAQGNPAQQYSAKGEIDLLNTMPKTTNGGLAASRPLLTSEQLESAIKLVSANPGKIAEYPIYQKSQINNAMSERGMRALTGTQFSKIQEAQANQNKTNATIDMLEEAFNTTSPSATQLETWSNFAGKYTGEKTKFNNQLVAYEGLVKASIGNLARSLFGEKGVLTDQDIARVRAALPDAKTSNKELAGMLFGYLKTLNGSIANGTITAYDYTSKEQFIDDIVGDLKGIKSSPAKQGSKPVESKQSVDGVSIKNGKFVVEE